MMTTQPAMSGPEVPDILKGVLRATPAVPGQDRPKYYGSRFCQRCGKRFELTAPRQQRCAMCEEAAGPGPVPPPVRPRPVFAPPAPVKATRPPAGRRPRPKVPPKPEAAQGARLKRAVTVNGTSVPGQRTLPMLRALAEAPGGLTTPDLAELIAPSASSWINALGSVRVLMLKQEKRGRVEQAGTVAGNRTRESILWRITDEGRRYVQEADDGERKAVAPSPPPAKPEPGWDESLWNLLPGTIAGHLAGYRLTSNGYRTLGDLLYVTGADLLALHGFGTRCLEAVREGLASRGLVLVDELGPEDIEDDSPPGGEEKPVLAGKSSRDRRAQRIAEARAGKRKINHLTEQAYNYDGCRCDECKFAHSFALALKRAKRKLAAGLPPSALSAAEWERVEDELAYREGREWYRWSGGEDGGVLCAVIPRWVADGWFTPRRTVLEQLETAMKVEP